MLPLERIIHNDNYTSAFNRANTALTVSSLCLNKCTVYIVDVDKFIKDCDDVAQVLIKYNKDEKLLPLYLWARTKLTKLFLKGNTGSGVRINCHADADVMDETIKALCKKIGSNNVIPFLRKLTYSTEQSQPTTHTHQ